ncbi:MAG TPA: dTMP kinase [Solimonas sp.]|nr:dTMP kinase [Solimonas sp.]
MSSRGRFITLEGGEGAGKSTQARAVRTWLEGRGRRVLQSREPGGSPLAEALRELVLRDWEEGIAPSTEALLMFAARAAHVRARIRPALEDGQDVVCDRFTDSSFAYQGAGKGVAEASLGVLEQLAQEGLRPDLVLLLDLPPELGLARAHARGQANRFEHESLDFMNRVREGFLRRARAEPARYVVIDASQDEPAVTRSVLAALEERL